MPTALALPTISCRLRSENVHLEADGPGFDSQHLHQPVRLLDRTPGAHKEGHDLSRQTRVRHRAGTVRTVSRVSVLPVGYAPQEARGAHHHPVLTPNWLHQP